MKHSLKITLVLLAFFIIAQYLGLLIVYNSIDVKQTALTGKVTFQDLPVGERPPIEEKTAYLPVIITIIIGTLLMLLLIKLKWTWVWKIWFLTALVLTLTTALGTFLPVILAFLLSLVVSAWRVFRPNFWVQNFTELFIYGGLAVIFVPLFNLWSISILLILIAIYDAYAVWKSKHMITLAKSQTEAKTFAGLYIPYTLGGSKESRNKESGNKESRSNKKKSTLSFLSNIKTAAKMAASTVRSKMGGNSSAVKNKQNISSVKVRTAILGGGDIGFPLFFAGVVLKEIGLWAGLVIPIFALLGLGLLLWKSEEQKFYPAMPFIGAGCFLGLAVVWGIKLLIGM